MMDELKERIKAGYEDVTMRIADAAARVNRSADEITVIAVTKTWPADIVVAAYELGIHHFGENRIEELAEKRAAVEARLGRESGITWHMIGTLQSRKTNATADHADYFHALDRMKIARRLSRRLEENGRELPTLIEVNVSGEESKSGFNATHWETDTAQRAKLRDVAVSAAELLGLEVRGLMTMAPWEAEPEAVRAIFQSTRELAAWLQETVPQATWDVLSMGMTDDFELAVEEGATLVRVGRAIFGERRY